MRFLSEKISKLNIGWNERPLVEGDFHCICEKFNVSIIETPLLTGGFYFRLLGREFIAVDCRLTGAAKLAVLFHELGHFLFHAPESGPAANFHHVGRHARKEIEADVFALCALIPKKIIESRSAAELIREGFPAEMIDERCEIHRRYGL